MILIYNFVCLYLYLVVFRSVIGKYNDVISFCWVYKKIVDLNGG